MAATAAVALIAAGAGAAAAGPTLADTLAGVETAALPAPAGACAPQEGTFEGVAFGQLPGDWSASLVHTADELVSGLAMTICSGVFSLKAANGDVVTSTQVTGTVQGVVLHGCPPLQTYPATVEMGDVTVVAPNGVTLVSGGSAVFTGELVHVLLRQGGQCTPVAAAVEGSLQIVS